MVEWGVEMSRCSVKRIWNSLPNPCPCGYFTNPQRACHCTPPHIQRYRADSITCNAELSPRLVRKYCRVDDASKRLLELAMQRFGLSARAYSRILKVARTIADLEERDAIQSTDVAEAIAYRSFDRCVGDRRMEGRA